MAFFNDTPVALAAYPVTDVDEHSTSKVRVMHTTPHRVLVVLAAVLAVSFGATQEASAGLACKPDVIASVATCDQGQVVKPQERTERPTLLAAVNTGDNPLCAKDGVCNLAVCSADPDCPGDLPPGVGAEPATTSIDLETVDCNSTQALDIQSVAWNLVDDWANFERTLETTTGFSVNSCLRNRFANNGRVVCESKSNGLLGRTSPLAKTIHIFGDFFSNISAATQPDRRACYAALMTHEFSHSCDRVFEKPRTEALEAAAFTYWQQRCPGTAGWPRGSINGVGCGMD